MTHSRTRVLLTTIHKPLGIESDTCTPNIQAEMYHAQVTRAQGIFSIRSVCTGWGLEFIAVNLDADVTVMHYPTLRQLVHELRRGYDYVGIGFVICTFPKVEELCRTIRAAAPNSKIVLGGYGTVLADSDALADYVCREEGVTFFRRLLGEPPVSSYRLPRIQRTLKVLGITTRPEAIIPAGLGCSRGCDFCCTSHFYGRRYYPLIQSGRELHRAMRSVDFGKSSFRNIGIIDEDFLADEVRIREMLPLNAAEIEKPILFSCLTSLKSISQFTTEELLMMGLAGAWVGVESRYADYAKLTDLDVQAIVAELNRVGIIPLTSLILGYDWHDERTVEEDFQYLWSLRPAFSQLMIYSPCPDTPLFEKLKSQGRLLNVPYVNHDGFHALFRHPHLSTERLEELVIEFFQREYEELGPSVCRVLEIQFQGYQNLRHSDHPLFRARAREYRSLCLQIYPLLRTAIRRAPSVKVRQHLSELRDRVGDALGISASVRLKEKAVPWLAMLAQAEQRLRPVVQPATVIHRFSARSRLPRNGT